MNFYFHYYLNMDTIKRWLRSWCFWLVLTLIFWVLTFCLIDDWKLADKRLVIFFLLSIAVFIMFLISVWHGENWIKKLTTIVICCFATLFICWLWLVPADLNSNLLDLLINLSVGVLIPSSFVLLLKLVWGNR